MLKYYPEIQILVLDFYMLLGLACSNYQLADWTEANVFTHNITLRGVNTQ